MSTVNKWRLVCVVLVLGTLLGVLQPANAAAATDNTFSITTSPLPILLNSAPGQTVTTDLRIKNDSLSPETLKVGLKKFNAASQLGQPNIMDRGPKDAYFDWVSFSPAAFTAQPNQWITVKMTIKIPSEAAFGYYFAVTFSPSATTNTSTDKPHTHLVGSTAILVLLNVKSPAEKRHLQITTFTADHGLYQLLPAAFQIKIHNDGNVYSSTGGTIFITRGKKVVDTIEVNQAGGNILPNSSRVFDARWSDGFPVYKPKLVDGKPAPVKKGPEARQLHWDFSQASKFRFGKYTANLTMIYNDGQRDVPMTATVSFWVIPILLVLIIILIVLLMLGGLWWLSRGAWYRANRLMPRKKTSKKQ